MTPPITIARACQQLDALKRELDQARIDRDTARALLAGMQGRGVL